MSLFEISKFKNLISSGDNTTTEEVIISSTANNTSINNGQFAASTQAIPQPVKPKKNYSFNEKNMRELPTKALYRMGFEVVPINQISTLKGRIVRITKNNNELIEGRVINVAPGSVIVDGAYENELPIASIKQLKLMVKKAN